MAHQRRDEPGITSAAATLAPGIRVGVAVSWVNGPTNICCYRHCRGGGRKPQSAPRQNRSIPPARDQLHGQWLQRVMLSDDRELPVSSMGCGPRMKRLRDSPRKPQINAAQALAQHPRALNTQQKPFLARPDWLAATWADFPARRGSKR